MSAEEAQHDSAGTNIQESIDNTEASLADLNDAQEKVDASIDELKGALNKYMKQSFDCIDPNNNHDEDDEDKAIDTFTNYIPNPSLSISESTVPSQVASISYDKPRVASISSQTDFETDNRDRVFYQCIFIAIMIGSFSILVSLIFHFFELRQQTAHRMHLHHHTFDSIFLHTFR